MRNSFVRKKGPLLMRLSPVQQKSLRLEAKMPYNFDRNNKEARCQKRTANTTEFILQQYNSITKFDWTCIFINRSYVSCKIVKSRLRNMHLWELCIMQHLQYEIKNEIFSSITPYSDLPNCHAGAKANLFFE